MNEAMTMRPMAMNETDYLRRELCGREQAAKPQPHGRLIDADALARQEAEAFKELNRNEDDPWQMALYRALHRYLQSHLEQAPTVVPEVEAP